MLLLNRNMWQTRAPVEVTILQYLACILDSFSKGAHEILRWWQPFLFVCEVLVGVFFPLLFFFLHVRKSLTNTHFASGQRYYLLLCALALFFCVKHHAAQAVHAGGSVCLEKQTSFESRLWNHVTWITRFNENREICTVPSIIYNIKQDHLYHSSFRSWKCLLLEWGDEHKGWILHIG